MGGGCCSLTCSASRQALVAADQALEGRLGTDGDAAKKEGQVTVYIYRYESLLQEFKREFPGINVVSVTGRGNELTNRVMAERRAGKFIADVYSAGTGGNYNVLYKGKALDPIKPLLSLPEVVDESKWYGKEHRYADAEGKYVFAYLASPSDAQLAFNSSWSIRRNSNPIGMSRSPNGKAKSSHSIRATADWAAPCSFSTITRKSARNLSKSFLAPWISSSRRISAK